MCQFKVVTRKYKDTNKKYAGNYTIETHILANCTRCKKEYNHCKLREINHDENLCSVCHYVVTGFS